MRKYRFKRNRWMSCDCSNLGQFSIHAFRHQFLGFMPGPCSDRNLMQIIGELIYTCKIGLSGETCIFIQV
jgi:hypothetical protein